MHHNEVYAALFGKRDGDFIIARGYFPSEGSPSRVSFDYQAVLDREKERGDLIGFYHTHPNMSNQYSSIDYETMETWCDATGKYLYCLIEGNNGIEAYGCYNFGNKFSMGRTLLRTKHYDNAFVLF